VRLAEDRPVERGPTSDTAHLVTADVPASEIGDPQNLGLKLWVNDVLKQDSNTGKMIFTLAEQIAQLSSRITLYPGDVILTGTPAGVGAGRGEFLKPGDVVKLWIEKIGTLTNTMA
jgi:2-keto-4-pentenoate hydratase/2-oxohepta-3-ene-1,7-dioic acid hydratase in catechol pathway